MANTWPFATFVEQKRLVHHRLTSQLRVVRETLSMKTNPTLYQEILDGLVIPDIHWALVAANVGQPAEAPNLLNTNGWLNLGPN